MASFNSVDPLVFTLPSSPFIDFLRVVASMLGIFLFIVSCIRWLQHARFYSAIGFMALGMMAALQELSQIGERFLVWRLPLLMIGCIAGIRYMYYSLAEIKEGPTR